MSYIGQPLNAGNLAVQTGTGDNTTSPIGSLNYSVGSSESLQVTLDGVDQIPGTDFTASGTSISFTSAVPTGVAIKIRFLALPISLPTPGDGTVDETKLKDALIGDFTDATVTASDTFLHGDASDSGNTKRDTIQGILDLGALASETVNATYNMTTASGTQSITGAGFTPTACIAIANINNVAGAMSIGFISSDTGARCLLDNQPAVDNAYTNSAYLIQVRVGGSSAIQRCTGAFTSDGIDLSWQKIGSPTGTLQMDFIFFK